MGFKAYDRDCSEPDAGRTMLPRGTPFACGLVCLAVQHVCGPRTG